MESGEQVRQPLLAAEQSSSVIGAKVKSLEALTALPSLCLRKSKIKASYHEKIQYASDEHKDAVDNLALVLNIISPQEAEGREEILTEMFSDYILMTKSIHRWAISSEPS